MLYDVLIIFCFFVSFILLYHVFYENKLRQKVDMLAKQRVTPQKTFRFGRGKMRAFEEGLFQGLEQLPRLLGAGLPLFDALRVLSEEKNLFARELGFILRDIDLGQDFNVALECSMERYSSEVYHYFITILKLQLEMGGGLKDVLENLHLMLRHKKRLLQKAKALSSESRFSILIIGSLPIILSAVLTILAPSYMMNFFYSPHFLIIFMIAIGFWSAGIFWMIHASRLDNV